ncbi:hypothetical protein CK203_101810 [Vitis vinifera]|uniref:Uncharacterized protein n=1 Tax=Vitis vinifera TaxID=29760 RepID=A0A438ET11_VITVI|nr:hypothetical protein CK203_101810 [Vitis vinifera]
MEKKDRGLGIKNLSRLNKALLGKWHWRFASEQDSLWKQVIVGKYGEEKGGCCSNASREGYGMGLWKAIKNGWMEFSNMVAFKAFPSLYSLASSRDAWVAQLWDQSRELGHWNPIFTRLNNDWGMEEVEAFPEGYMVKCLEGTMRMSCLGGFQRMASLQLSLSTHP